MSEAPVRSRRIRILVVEDEDADFLVTQALLRQMDDPPVDVHRAASYGEALRNLEEWDFDVALVDYVLEDGTGLDLVRSALDRGIRAPMIMLTGKGSHEIDLRAMRAGVADYLDKRTLGRELLERSIRYALERHRAGEALRDSEERLRTLFDRLPLGLYRITPDGEFLDANPALIRLLGSPTRDALRSLYSTTLYVREEDRAEFHRKLMTDGVVLGFETHLKRRGGDVIHVRNSARVHRRPDGSVEYIEGALEDVTDVARARRVHESEAYYRALVDATSMGVLLVGLDGVVAEANAAAASIFGCTVADLEGQGIAHLFEKGERGGVTRDFASAQNGSSPRVEADRRLRRVSGEALWARVIFTPVRDPVEGIVHVMCLLEDVAETSEPVLDRLA